MLSDGEFILVAGALLAAGWLASLIAERFRLPSLVLFLAIGMAIGSDGTDWIDFDDYEVARTIGVITATIILFEAGLAAGFAGIRPVLRPAISLATLGTFLTAAIAGLAAVWLFDFHCFRACLWDRSSPPPTVQQCSRFCVRSISHADCREPWRPKRAWLTRSPFCLLSHSSN